MSLRTKRRAEEEANHAARMEMYLADLRAWPVDVALKALERWPEQSQWWPSWHELLQLLSEYRSVMVPALPRPAQPEHRPIERATNKPLASRQEWDAHQGALAVLRSGKPMWGGPRLTAALLQWGERIEARNRPHAERMGWV